MQRLYDFLRQSIEPPQRNEPAHQKEHHSACGEKDRIFLPFFGQDDFLVDVLVNIQQGLSICGEKEFGIRDVGNGLQRFWIQIRAKATPSTESLSAQSLITALDGCPLGRTDANRKHTNAAI